jgi:hypothetical protein
MASYFVAIKSGPQNSSDAAVGTKPTGSSKILEAAQTAVWAKIEAASYAEAVEAARITYGAEQTPLAAEVANVKSS